jgi:hypothetical protein
VFSWAEMVLCTDFGDIAEIGVWEFGIEEVEGCVSCMQDECLLSVMERGRGLLLGIRCIGCRRILCDILGLAFGRKFELHDGNGH